MRRVRSALVLCALGLGLAAWLGASAQDDEVPDDSPARLRAELAVMRREVAQLRGRVAQLEATVAALTTTVVPERPEVSRELGFVFPGMPRGNVGAQSAGDLAALVYQAAGRAPQDVEPLLAFGREGFYVPEALWTPTAQGLGTLVGLPTRDEIELVLHAMKPSDMETSLGGIVDVPGAAPRGAEHVIRVIELTVVVSGKADTSRTETYRLTAVRIDGRWFAAHILSITAEEDARSFLEDLVKSQRSYHVFYQVRYAKSLRELADDREKLEASGNLRRAGLTFPLGKRLDRLAADKLEWSKEGELSGPFYRFRVAGDESGGWTGIAVPRSPSYQGFAVQVPASARIGDPVPVRATRGSAQ